MRQRRLLVIATALILGLLAYLGSAALLPAPVASAHAYVIGSDPVDGSVVNTVPSVVRIFFNAPVSSISEAHVYSIQNGNLVDVGSAPSSVAPSSSRELDIPLKTPSALPQGSYEIIWTAVASDDGHTTHGIIGFDVGFSSTGLSGTRIVGPSTSNDLYGAGGSRMLDFIGALSVAWDWLIFLALAFWIGILAAERLILARTENAWTLLDRARRQASSLQWLCLVVLLVGEVVTLLLRSINLARVSGGNLDLGALAQLIIATSYGHLWLVRIVLLIVALVLLRWTGRTQDAPQRAATRSGPLRQTTGQESRSGNSTTATKERPAEDAKPAQALSMRYTPAWLLLAGLIVLTYALTSDAAQVLQPHISAIVFDWLYRIAQGIWFGGLAYLGYILLPQLLVVDQDHRAETLVVLLRRFTPFLLAGMGVLLVSDLFLSEASISSPQQLLNDPYAKTLVVQSIILIALTAASAYMIFIQGPRLIRQALLLPVVNPELPARRTRQSALEQSRRSLKQGLNIQSWLAAGVLLCAALMAFLAPPINFPAITSNNAQSQSVSATTAGAQTKQAGDLSVTLQVLPGRVGDANTVIVTINDRSGNPVTNAQVQLTTNMQIMDMGTARKTIAGGNPVYIATFSKQESFSMAGVWVIGVRIQRPGQSPVQVTFPVTLNQ
jgi:methionine-rich copper-binding protein CopC/putative copper export protein